MADWSLDTPSRGDDAHLERGVSPASSAKRWKMRPRLSWMIAGFVFLLVGALIGFYVARWQSGDEAAELARDPP